MKDDLVRRQAAITAIQKAYADTEGGADRCAVWKNVGLTNALHIMQDLPSAQPEITDGQAIEHLQSTGWMQNHDKQMYEMGLKEKLADDSDGYDSLIPSAQPDDWMERNKERILQAGMEGREIEFRIGGRLFAIREKAQ